MSVIWISLIKISHKYRFCYILYTKLFLLAQINETKHSALASSLSQMLLPYFIVKDHTHRRLHMTKFLVHWAHPYKLSEGKTSFRVMHILWECERSIIVNNNEILSQLPLSFRRNKILLPTKYETISYVLVTAKMLSKAESSLNSYEVCKSSGLNQTNN